MAMILQIVFAGLGITLASIIKWHLTRKNKKLRAEAERLGIDYNPGPAVCCRWLLEHIHVYTGLPWWGRPAGEHLR